MRLQRSLSGQWNFQVDPAGTIEVGQIQSERQITVPMPWQAAIPELRQYEGWAWYQIDFELDPSWLEGELLLKFGAVDYWCAAYINGECIGEHEGGYTPFAFPIRRFVQPGRNSLAVHVYDPVQKANVIPRWSIENDGSNTKPPFAAEHVPHGKQEWYLNVGGIWQDVTLTAVPQCYLDHAHVTPDIHTGEARVTVQIGGKAAGGEQLSVNISGVTAQMTLQPAQKDATLVVKIPNPQLWTTETPFLYEAHLHLENDDLIERFGFREIVARDGCLYLNGEPLYLLCALDQDLYPETIYTVPSREFLRDQFQKAKELGLNSLRCHIKPPDPLYLDLADEMGLLIWAEIPSWRTFHVRTEKHPASVTLNDAIRQRVGQTLEEMIRRDYNHPSLIIWTIVNEDWGTALFMSESDRAWLAGMVDTCKALDPTRLVVDNSPCPAPWGLSTHVKTDIEDFHIYANIPDAASTFDRFVEQFANRPLWSFSNHGDSQRTGREPIILSEFGNWGLPTLSALAPDGNDPHWFDLGAWWAGWEGEPGYPQGVRERFETFGLNAVWTDFDGFATSTQWHQFEAMKFEIEAMRRHNAIVGYVITEFTDAYWESNGLLDFNRGVKVYHQRMKQVNALDVIIPKLRRYAYWDDETVRILLYGSHYSRRDWASLHLKTIYSDKEFEQALPALQQGEVRAIAAHRYPLSAVEQPAKQTFRFQIDHETENEVSVLVLPSNWRKATYKQPVAVFSDLDPDDDDAVEDMAPFGTQPGLQDNTELSGGQSLSQSPALKTLLRYYGYNVTPKLDGASLVVTDTPDRMMLDWVRQGGDMLYLSSSSSPFFWRQSRGGAYSGNWMTSFSWLRPGVYQRLNVENPLGLAFREVMPEGTFVGLPVEDARYHADFLAGQITGWIGHPAIHTVQFRYGQGRVIATTFSLRKTLTSQPVAVAMLHDLIDHLTTNCHPVLSANY